MVESVEVKGGEARWQLRARNGRRARVREVIVGATERLRQRRANERGFAGSHGPCTRHGVIGSQGWLGPSERAGFIAARLPRAGVPGAAQEDELAEPGRAHKGTGA